VGAEPPPPWPELAGQTLVILGYGRIGQCLARRARAFDMSVVALRRTPVVDGLATVLPPEAVDDVLKRADAVVITMPLTAETRGLLGTRELALMKPTALLLNPARAEIVDEDALYEALAARRIAAPRWTSGTATRPPPVRARHLGDRSTVFRASS
jgi:phosphoglycerate dehydrogenase-like enzyme